ncbi:MAG: OmpH family outer membrane protein [Gammaproteobacteria bacterium]|jgi:outer membrane protein
MKKIILICIAIFSIAFITNSYADTSTNIGVLDVQKIMQSSPKIQAAGEKLKAKFTPQQNKIMAKQQALKNLMDKYNRDAPIMSDSVKQKLKNQIIAARKEYTTMSQNFEQELMKAQQQEMQKLTNDLQNIVAKIAKKNNLNMILTKQAIIYSGDTKDITDQVLKAMK